MLRKIYTIGHSNIEPAEFIKNLSQYSINALIDVRSLPYSQYASQFNKEKLEHFCHNNEISYFFLGNLLGGKPKDNSIIDSKEKINYYKLSQKDYFLSGIDRLLFLSQQYNLCLMCSEGQPDKCHRNLLLAPALEKEGLEVIHILPDGNNIHPSEIILAKNNGQLVLF